MIILMNSIEKVFVDLKQYFFKGETLDIDKRILFLKSLKCKIIENETRFISALSKDMNKSPFDVLSTELTLIIDELNFLIKKTKSILKRKRVKTNLINFPAKSYIEYEPYGCVLVYSPWNYPLQLSLIPVFDAIACGNTVILKPSEYCVNTSKVMEEIFNDVNPQWFRVINGDTSVAQTLLSFKFDYIFFTGSTAIGKIVMKKASENLIPVTLELGGKSPCIVTDKCDINLAAKRIVWGKFLNAGQTCVAPDYILVHKNIKKEFIKCVIYYIKTFYYAQEKISADFTHIINEAHLNRLLNLIDKDKVIFGGNHDDLCLEPTLMDQVNDDDLIMKEEIFGPIMPIMEYENIKDVISYLKGKEKSLALYIFTNDKTEANLIFKNVSFGGGCINDTIMHLCNLYLPFGGVGTSGIGNYHGKYSLTTFSHCKSVFIKGKAEFKTKYPPINDKKTKFLKRISKL